MLHQLRIENFAIIDHLDLSFAAGLNILTGETGAGKSIIVDALELLVGARAALDQIRTGSDQALVEVAIHLPQNGVLRGPLIEQGLLQPGEDELILRRIISRSGKGRIQVNGHLVTLSTLQEIGRGLVDIHGQHDHQSLLYPDHQIDLLDAYGQILSLREEYSLLYQQQRALRSELESLRKILQERGQREEYLKFQVREIQSAHLQPGEDLALEKEREILAHSEKLSQHAETADHILYESEESVLGNLVRAGGHLKEIELIDHRFADTRSLWEAALTQFKEVAEQVRHYKNGIQHDPDRLQEIEERLHVIGKLKKKYGPSLEEVLSHLTKLSEELSSLEVQEERSSAVEKDYQEKREKVFELADRLSGQRNQTAKRFNMEIKKELQHLGMEQTQFVVRIDHFKDDLDQWGADRINFLIATQPGEEPRPLSKVASGGELSRVMLAIKTILADEDRIPILIFDEVDAGIGGAVAEAVGRRLKTIARRRQVFCITHLPQIAMLADEHYRVEKTSQDGRTVTRIRQLNRSEKIREIARMLGGREITPITLKHAREMLNRSDS